MTTELQVPLSPGWVEESEPNPSGVRTFFRSSTRSGPLQFSWWSLDGYDGPLSTEMGLCALAASYGEEQFGCGPARDTSSGRCDFGLYGTAVFSAPPDKCHGEIWFLFNGDGVVLATYMSAQPPNPEELEEARRIISKTRR